MYCLKKYVCRRRYIICAAVWYYLYLNISLTLFSLKDLADDAFDFTISVLLLHRKFNLIRLFITYN